MFVQDEYQYLTLIVAKTARVDSQGRQEKHFTYYKVPFTKELLTQLYPAHAAHVKKVSEKIDALVKSRLITRADGMRIKQEAAQAAVP